MRVFRGQRSEILLPRSVVTVGNFEGLHLAHQALIEKLVDKSVSLGLPSVVMTFDPNPKVFFAKKPRSVKLMSLKEKLALLRAFGVDAVYLIRFDAAMAKMSAPYFVESFLHQKLNCKHLIVGDDFHFGHQRIGDAKMLQSMGARLGFDVVQMPPISVEGQRVSSTRIRQCLKDGDLKNLVGLLGRRYQISVPGFLPTAQARRIWLKSPKVCLPQAGCYEVELDARRQGVLKIGAQEAAVHALQLEQPWPWPQTRPCKVTFIKKLPDGCLSRAFERMQAQPSDMKNMSTA